MTKEAEKLMQHKLDALKLLYHSPDGIRVEGDLKWRGYGLKSILHQLVYKNHWATLSGGRVYINEAGMKRLMKAIGDGKTQITESQLLLFV